MHDMNLLKMFSKTQLELVISLDPLTHGNDVWGAEMLERLKQFIRNRDLINDLLLSWAKQLDENGDHKIASSYYGAHDERTGNHRKRDHAIRIGSFDFLNEIENKGVENVEWFHYAESGHNALRKEEADVALKCFSYAQGMVKEKFVSGDEKALRMFKKNIRRLVRNVKTILNHALHEADFDLVNVCLAELGRKLTQPEWRMYRARTTHLFVKNKLRFTQAEHTINLLTEHGSESEKRMCMNAVAARGETKNLEELSRLWNIPVTERHLKLALAKYWYTELNGGNATKRLEIATKLVALSPQYESMFLRACISARNKAIGWGEIVRGNEIGKQIRKPVTLDELTDFLRMHGRDDRHQKTEIPFAIAKMIEIVDPKTNSEEIADENIHGSQFFI